MTLENYNILEGKTISWIIENCEYVEKFNLDEINKDDIIMYFGGFIQLIRGGKLENWDFITLKEKKELLINYIYTGDGLISLSLFTDITPDVNIDKSIFPHQHTLNYNMLQSYRTEKSLLHYFNLDRPLADPKAVLKIKKLNKLGRHKGGVRWNQLNQTFLIKQNPKSKFINWPLRNPMEVKE